MTQVSFRTLLMNKKRKQTPRLKKAPIVPALARRNCGYQVIDLFDWWFLVVLPKMSYNQAFYTAIMFS